MIHPPTAPEVEAAAHEVGMSISALCREAGVDPSTFWRWKKGGTSPSVETVRRMAEVIEKRASSQ